FAVLCVEVGEGALGVGGDVTGEPRTVYVDLDHQSPYDVVGAAFLAGLGVRVVRDGAGRRSEHDTRCAGRGRDDLERALGVAEDAGVVAGEDLEAAEGVGGRRLDGDVGEDRQPGAELPALGLVGGG